MKKLQYLHPKSKEWLSLEDAKNQNFVKEEKGKLKFKNKETGRFVVEKTASKKGFIRVAPNDNMGISLFDKKSDSKVEPTISGSFRNTRFLLIPRKNLLTYFTHALIYPTILDNRQDGFSQNEDFLTLHERVSHVNDDELVLELSLSTTELKNIDGINQQFILPVSRIKGIYGTEENLRRIKSELQTFEDTFIPHKLFFPLRSLLSSQQGEITNRVSEPVSKYGYDVAKFRERKDYFNRLLGMLSYMKCTNIYFADENKVFSPYSKSFFSFLNLINIKFSTQNDKKAFWKKFLFEGSQNTLLDKVLQDIKNGREVNKDWVKTLIADAPEDIQIIFEKTVFRDYKKEALEKLNKSEWWEYYVLAALYNYRKDNSIVQLPQNIANDVSPQFAEIVLAVLGFYYGYAKLPRTVPINLKDSFFNELSDKFANLKFKLDFQLDYKIIETIYQYCFHNKVGGFNLEYINAKDSFYSRYNLPKNYVEEQYWQFGEKFSTYENQREKQLNQLRQRIYNQFKQVIFSTNEQQLQKIQQMLQQIN